MNKVVAAIIIVVLGIGGVGTYIYLNLNSLVKEGIEVAGRDALGVQVSVDQVNISLLSGSGHISGLRIANPEGFSSARDAISVDDIEVLLEISSLTSNNIVIKNVILRAPEINYETTVLDSNLKQLQTYSNTEVSDLGAQEPESDAEPISVLIDHLEIHDAKIALVTPLLDKAIPLKLPFLEFNDLGKEEDASVQQIINKVLAGLNKALIPLIKENAGIGKQLKDAGSKLTDKLKGLFD